MCAGHIAQAQLMITGTVFDNTKVIPVKDVVVKSSSGTMAITDSNGRYSIAAGEQDSLTFIYLYKPTAKFTVKQIPNIAAFDISLHVKVKEQFQLLKEVKIYSKSYRQDSIENREQYAKVFNYQRPTLRTGTDSYTGAAGLDVNELINIFRFKRNRQIRRLQERLMEQEKENYINYRFNKMTVRRITHLDGKDLDLFMQEYRPDFEFTSVSTLVDFYQYILNASYQFKRERLISEKVQDSIIKK